MTRASSVGTGTYSMNGPLNSEERLALENLDMGDGLSDSSSTNTMGDTGPKKTHWKKCGKIPEAPRNRDAMGNYITPFGEKPLSSFSSECSPGPNHYDPVYTVTQKVYPQYSLGMGPPMRKPGPRMPGPKYNTGNDMKWGKCRRFTLKIPLPIKRERIGPGPTSAKLKPFKPSGPKYSIAGRAKKPCILNSSLVMPLNSETPGPQYTPKETEWTQRPVSMGTVELKSNPPPGPDPGKYSALDVEKSGPKYSMAPPGVKKYTTLGPGPGRYKLKTTIGKNGFKAPLGIRHVEPDYKAFIPGPDIYHRAGFRLDEPGVTMKYRWMDGPASKAPGPADYVVTDLKSCKGPAFTIKSKQKEKVKQGPGPADYCAVQVKCSGDPGKTFGVRLNRQDKKTETMTSEYVDMETVVKVLPSAPSYSFGGQRTDKRKVKRAPPLPSPMHYIPELPKSKKTISFGRRYPAPKPPIGPGPARPVRVEELADPCPDLNGPATTMKSRHTPLKFSGMKNSALIKTNRNAECVQLLG